MIRLGIVIVFFMLIVSERAWSADRSTQIDMLNGYFGSGCSINGDWTQAAQKSVRGLIETLKIATTDPACSSLFGLSNELISVNNSISDLQNPHNDVDLQLLSYQSQKREILALLANASDSVEVTQLNSALLTVQLEISRLSARRPGDLANRRSQRISRAMAGLVSASNQIFQQAASSPQCWLKNPGLLEQIAALGSAMGQGASYGYASSGKAVVVGASLSLLDSIVNFFKNLSKNREIEVLEDSLSSTALTCALENMAEIYCGAEDTKNAIKDLRIRNQTDLNHELWQGIAILQRDLPSTLSWLESVRTGSDPTSSATASLIANYNSKVASLANSKAMTKGFVEELRAKYDATKTDLGRWNIIRSLIMNMISPMIYPNCGSGCRSNNPIADLSNSLEFPYLLAGFPKDKIPQANGAVKPFEQASELPEGVDFSLPSIESRFNEFWRQADTALAIEKTTVLNSDSQLIISQAFTPSLRGAEKGLSPFQSFLAIVAFLKAQVPSSVRQAGLPKFYQETIQVYQDLADILIKVRKDINLQPPEKAEEIAKAGLMKIISRARLENGLDYLRNRTDYFVRVQLEDAVLNNRVAGDTATIKYLAAFDVVEYLRAISGKDTQQLVSDANNAQRTIISAYHDFVRLFKLPLSKALRQMDEVAVLMKEHSDDPYASSLQPKAILCANLLALPAWNFAFDMEKCRGTSVLSASYPGLRTPSMFPELMNQMKFTDRMCSYREFLRKNAIYKSLGKEK